MLTVRINKETEKKLNNYSQLKNLSKSAIVKEALEAYLSKAQVNESPYELGKDLFGTAGSGNASASVGYKSRLKKKINEKHSH